MDFTTPGDEGILKTSDTLAEYNATEGALELTTVVSDPHFTIEFEAGYNATDYQTLEIVYKIDDPDLVGNSGGNMQIFICLGDVKVPEEIKSVIVSLTFDGEYNTATVNLSALYYWTGDINSIRIDYFNRTSGDSFAADGDTMFIQSIKLVPAE